MAQPLDTRASAPCGIYECTMSVDIDFGGVGALVADVDAGGEGGGGDGLALEGEVFGFLIRQVGCGVGDG